MNEISDNQKFMQHTVRCSKSDYENLNAICPSCGRENVFNRASDFPNRMTNIDKFFPISREKVTCEYCKIPFPIGRDVLGESYQYFIWDCEELIKQKKYMFCIINLCQACEAFFLKGMVIKLAIVPYRNSIFGSDNQYIDNRTQEEHFNDVIDLLFEKIQKFTYPQMRNIFMDLFFHDKRFSSIKAIKDYITMLRKISTIPDSDIRRHQISNTKSSLDKLVKYDIDTMRNRVVHKFGYRPTRDETLFYLEQTQRIIGGLFRQLKFENYYFP